MTGGRSHTTELDGLRGVAVLVVICSHFYGLFGINHGGLGVDIFFALSGFLITRILVTELNDTGSIALLNFYARRFLRLVPALVVMVACVSIIYVALGSSPSAIFHRAAPALLYYSNWVRAFELWNMHALGHTWSLAIEEQFYILWPLIILAGARILGAGRLAWLCAALAIAVVLHRLNLMSDGATNARITNGLDTRADTLLIGAVLGAFSAHRPLASRWLPQAALLGFAALLFMIVYKPTWYYGLGITLTALSASFIIANAVANTDSLANRILQSRFLVFTGTISYGLYLWHYPLVRFVGMMGLDTAPPNVKHTVSLFVLLPVSYAICWTSYRWIEAPALSLKAAFSTGKPARSPAAPYAP